MAMQYDSAPPQPNATPATAGSAPRHPAFSAAIIAPIICLLAMFAWRFDPNRDQRLVNGCWLAALLLWATYIRALDGQRTGGLRLRRRDAWPLLALLAVFVPAWLPFYRNWRWAYTGDTLGYYSMQWTVAVKGPYQNVLSVRGLDDHFTYLVTIAYGVLMYLFDATLFWHRASLLLMSCLAMAVIYLWFVTVVGRAWAFAVVLGMALNYVWIWCTYSSYGKSDSFIFGFATLIFGTTIWRHPERFFPWMCCGITGGLALFFEQTAWAEVAAVNAVLGLTAIRQRRFAALAVLVVSFLLAAIPLLLQWPVFFKMNAGQADSVFTLEYLRRIFLDTFFQPYESPLFGLGVQGPFFPEPLGTSYLCGVTLAAASTMAPIRRALRIPPVAPVILALVLWETVLMTLTNNGYFQPSMKRTYHLIPLQMFLALLPYQALVGLAQPRPRLHAAAVAIVVAVFAAYGVNNARLLLWPAPGIYGDNVFDAMIEVRQRFPERSVVLFSSRERMPEWVAGYHEWYQVNDTVRVESAFSAETLAAACHAKALVCYEPDYDDDRIATMFGDRYVAVRVLPLLNTHHARCLECGG